MPAIDKSSWPKLAPLPADLPAAAKTMPAKYHVYSRFTAGSFAGSASDGSTRVGTAPNEFQVYAAKDVGAAIAAAAEMAGKVQPNPNGSPDRGGKTLIGLYQGTHGALILNSLWDAPGTNDVQSYYPIASSAAKTPDARFRFSDDKLLAVVAQGGWIINPDRAEALGTYGAGANGTSKLVRSLTLAAQHSVRGADLYDKIAAKPWPADPTWQDRDPVERVETEFRNATSNVAEAIGTLQSGYPKDTASADALQAALTALKPTADLNPFNKNPFEPRIDTEAIRSAATAMTSVAERYQHRAGG